MTEVEPAGMLLEEWPQLERTRAVQVLAVQHTIGMVTLAVEKVYADRYVVVLEVLASGPDAGDIDWLIKFKGDATLVVTDNAGNVTETSCLVPPPAK